MSIWSPEWRNTRVLSATIFFTLTAVSAWYRILSLYYRELGADEADTGWFFLALAMTHRLPGILGGLLADRFGRKKLLVGGTALMTIGFVGAAFARNPTQLTLAIGLSWFFGAIQWPGMLSLLADPVPAHERGRALALLEFCSMAGFTVGPLMEALVFRSLGSLPATWRLLLLVTTGVYLAVSLARLLYIRETWTSQDAVDREPVRPGLAVIPAAAYALFIGAVLLTEEGPALAWYIKDETGGDPGTVGWVHFIGGFVAMISALAAGHLADRIGPGRAVLLSFALMAAAYAPFVQGGLSSTTARALFILGMIPVELFAVAHQKLITTVAPRGRRALYVGICTTTSGVLSTWALLGCGLLYRRHHAAPFLAAVGVAVLGFIVSLPLLRKRYS